jgi:hypothetical protein
VTLPVGERQHRKGGVVVIVNCMFCEKMATWRGSWMGLPNSRYVKPGMEPTPVECYRTACDEHKDRLDGLTLEPMQVPVLGKGKMSFRRACELLGYDTPQKWMSKDTREGLIGTAVIFSDNGLMPIDPRTANRIRAEVEMFG